MTNAERIAAHIAKYGAEGIMIHSVPRTPFWLICQKRSHNNWSISIGHPLQTTRRLVRKDITDDEHVKLYNQLIVLEVSNRMREAIKELRAS